MDGQQIAALGIVVLTAGLMVRGWLRRRARLGAGVGVCARCDCAAGRKGERRKPTLERRAEVH